MTTRELMAYAEKRIAELRLGAGGDLGTEFVCVYDDAGPGAVRLGHFGGGREVNDKILEALEIAERYMNAREPTPEPEWLRTVRDAIRLRREELKAWRERNQSREN